MKQEIGRGLLVGALLTPALTAVAFLGSRLWGLPNPAFDLFDFTARILPGPVVTFGIDRLIDVLLALRMGVADTAKTAERAMATVQFWALGTSLIALGFALWRRVGTRRWTALLPGLALALLLMGVHAVISRSSLPLAARLAYLAALALLWSWAAYAAWRRLQPAPAADPELVRLGRRRFLIGFGAATATVTVSGAGLAAILARVERQRRQAAYEASLDAAGAQTTVGGTGRPLPNLEDPVIPAPGTRPEYTPIPDHYKVFINTEPSLVDEEDWTLEVTGLVDTPLSLTRRALVERYPAHDQFNTITCISGRVGTDLISTTLWTGVRLVDVLAEAGVRPEARYLIMTSADGYHETLDLTLLNEEPRVLLAYAWDGLPLPQDHGFPLRIWIPDRYGMKQPKWITGLELTDTYRDGYWVRRNWDKEAIVKTTSVIDTVAVEQAADVAGERLVPVGGIAYAGARGISAVEVRVDGGAWQPAQLRAPLSDSTWVIWRYEWPFSPGNHLLEVRCREAGGTPQIEERQGSRPDGSSGIHSYDVDV